MDPWIDSHCHLSSGELHADAAAVLDRAAAAGVIECVTIATDLQDAQRAIAMSDEHAAVRVVAGIHPHEAGHAAEGWDRALLSIVRRDDVFAVGETGLDYHYDFAEPAAQRHVFRRQLEIACEVGKPVVIHCRDAQRDALDELRSFPTLRGAVFHCFTGTQADADEILDRGHWISLTGVVTFKKSDKLRAVARNLPADRFMIETDAPYLSPEPLRSRRPNEPAHLIHTARRIAAARGISTAELSALTLANTRRFFSLPHNSAMPA